MVTSHDVQFDRKKQRPWGKKHHFDKCCSIFWKANLLGCRSRKACREKYKGNNWRANFVSHFAHTFWERNFPQDFPLESNRVYLFKENKREKKIIKLNRTNRCCTLVVARLSSSSVFHIRWRILAAHNRTSREVRTCFWGPWSFWRKVMANFCGTSGFFLSQKSPGVHTNLVRRKLVLLPLPLEKGPKRGKKWYKLVENPQNWHLSPGWRRGRGNAISWTIRFYGLIWAFLT